MVIKRRGGGFGLATMGSSSGNTSNNISSTSNPILVRDTRQHEAQEKPQFVVQMEEGNKNNEDQYKSLYPLHSLVKIMHPC